MTENTTENTLEQVAGTTVDASGLLSELLAKPAISSPPPSEFEQLLEKPPVSMREKLVLRAIEAVAKGEFVPVNGYYYNREWIVRNYPRNYVPGMLKKASACGCAIAALYYAGVQLEVAADVEHADIRKIHDELNQHIPREHLFVVEKRYEGGLGQSDWHTPGSMIESLKTLL